jgi:hypothetical protein
MRVPKKLGLGKHNNVGISSGQSRSLVNGEGRNGASNGVVAGVLTSVAVGEL